jgi:hypothetical protein
MLPKLIIDFHIGHYNGTMGMKIHVNDTLAFFQQSFDQEKLQFVWDIDMPGRVRIEVFNKQHLDTLVDDQQKIIRDKYIKIEKISLGGVVINTGILHNMIILQTNNGQLKSSYFGFNGYCDIPFDQKNSFYWHLDLMNKYQNSERDTVPTKYIELKEHTKTSYID